MIPPFTIEGFLPEGVHVATLAEVEERFVTLATNRRRGQVFEKFKELFSACQQVRFVKRILLAGSFVTAKPEPNDFDCILVLDPMIRSADLSAAEYNLASKHAVRRNYGGDIFPLIEDTEPCQTMIEFFQLNKSKKAVGIVEVLP